MARRKHSRVYARTRGGEVRYYGDFRDYAREGGGQEALIAKGERRATTDPDVATKLAADRLNELEGRRRQRALVGTSDGMPLAQYAEYHLVEKKRSGNVTDVHLAISEKQLSAAVEFFGAGRDLNSISTQDVQKFAAQVASKSNRGKGTRSAGTVRKFLNALSNLYRRAMSEGSVPELQRALEVWLQKSAIDCTFTIRIDENARDRDSGEPLRQISP